MDSTSDSSSDEVDLDAFRKVYESDEHWQLRKVKKFFLFTFRGNSWFACSGHFRHSSKRIGTGTTSQSKRFFATRRSL